MATGFAHVAGEFTEAIASVKNFSTVTVCLRGVFGSDFWLLDAELARASFLRGRLADSVTLSGTRAEMSFDVVISSTSFDSLTPYGSRRKLHSTV